MTNKINDTVIMRTTANRIPQPPLPNHEISSKTLLYHQ